MTTATTEVAIRAALKTAVIGVSNVGQVHDYERWAVLYEDFISFFVTTITSTKTIRGWTIALESIKQENEAYGERGANNRQIFTYKIRGYYGLDDGKATEKSAVALACGVIDAIDAATTIIGGDADVPLFGPASLDVIEPREFGSTLVHYIEITQTAYRFT